MKALLLVSALLLFGCSNYEAFEDIGCEDRVRLQFHYVTETDSVRVFDTAYVDTSAVFRYCDDALLYVRDFRSVEVIRWYDSSSATLRVDSQIIYFIIP